MVWDPNEPGGVPRAVCFDLYGTLVEISVDTSSPALWSRFCMELAQQGIHADAWRLHARYDELTERARRQFGEPFVLDHWFFYNLLEARQPEESRVVQHLGRRFRALSTTHLNLKTYSVPLLRELRQFGCRLAIVSNTEAIVTSYDLEHLQLARFFDAVVISSAVGARKPEKRIFEIALDRLGAAPQECVFVGDDLECDYVGPRNVGIRSVLVCSGHRAVVPCVRPELGALLEAICGTIFSPEGFRATARPVKTS